MVVKGSEKKVAEKLTGKGVEAALEKGAQKVTEETLEKGTQKVTEKAAAEAAAKKAAAEAAAKALVEQGAKRTTELGVERAAAKESEHAAATAAAKRLLLREAEEEAAKKTTQAEFKTAGSAFRLAGKESVKLLERAAGTGLGMKATDAALQPLLHRFIHRPKAPKAAKPDSTAQQDYTAYVVVAAAIGAAVLISY